jgi:hypothetical protein
VVEVDDVDGGVHMQPVGQTVVVGMVVLVVNPNIVDVEVVDEVVLEVVDVVVEDVEEHFWPVGQIVEVVAVVEVEVVGITVVELVVVDGGIVVDIDEVVGIDVEVVVEVVVLIDEVDVPSVV